ncbi:hypothetical protein C7450_11384 [Chelatococcus asaccharovorans]|uniref:Uncharacterized protein n=1 Tax=Chelatococcus asaccharovorans TaxID=28210 RepID=A0A2V3TXZ3_9HYPH|nr:hypothetical protein C7450_11384 [Chelatococcus asaccharovorans]
MNGAIEWSLTASTKTIGCVSAFVASIIAAPANATAALGRGISAERGDRADRWRMMAVPAAPAASATDRQEP